MYYINMRNTTNNMPLIINHCIRYELFITCAAESELMNNSHINQLIRYLYQSTYPAIEVYITTIYVDLKTPALKLIITVK